MVEIEVYIVVDAEGNSAIGETKEQAIERYEEEVGSLNECDGFRIVRGGFKVPRPDVMEVEVQVEDVIA